MNTSPFKALSATKLKIVVIGGGGLIGAKVVADLQKRGHEVIAASRSSGVNAVTGEGLAQTLAETQVVVDVSNSPTFEDQAVMDFFEKSGRNLLAAEAVAGVGHHVLLSIVGTDQLLASGYFRGKMAQENLVRVSLIPYTIVRATQFFEFVGGIADLATKERTVRLPAARMQPILSDDVATIIADAALAEPLNGMVELAGPDQFGQDEFVRKFLSAKRDPRTVMTDPRAPYYGVLLNDQSLAPGKDPIISPTHFSDWLRRIGEQL
jgi:uncharacterized protein YbjT (DUF2867 family)